MLKSKLFWQGNMAVAAVGWMFIVYGLVVPLPEGFIQGLWWVVFFLWVIGHPLELIMSLPVGKRLNLPTGRIVAMTLVFGITWWVPLKLGVFRESP